MRLSSVIIICFVVSTFFTSTGNAQTSGALMLTLSYNTTSDQTAVRFMTEASDTFDSPYDVYKMLNPSPTPNIYTVTDQMYALNSMNNDFTEKVISLNVQVASPATYTLTAEELYAFDPSWTIQLTDLLLNQVIDLRTVASYSFMADPADSSNRFSLTFTHPKIFSLFAKENPKDIDHMIYTDQDKIIVSPQGEKVSVASINDLQGNVVWAPETSSETRTFSPDKTGIYVVHLSTDQHNYTKKVMISKN
jgi:hypothetical protein